MTDVVNRQAQQTLDATGAVHSLEVAKDTAFMNIVLGSKAQQYCKGVFYTPRLSLIGCPGLSSTSDMVGNESEAVKCISKY